MKSFSTFCLNHNYLTQNPTAGISSLGRKGKKKLRNILPPEALAKVSDYLKSHSPYMLLASYILYYCFIRPAEMVGLRLNDISLKKQTIFVSDNISKIAKMALLHYHQKSYISCWTCTFSTIPVNIIYFLTVFVPVRQKDLKNVPGLVGTSSQKRFKAFRPI